MTTITLVDHYLFYTLNIIITVLISSFIVLYNPVLCLITLISALFILFLMILLLLKIEFMALIFLIVYLGAITILFLFVIMMIDIRNIYSEVNASSKYDLLVVSLFSNLTTFTTTSTLEYNFNKRYNLVDNLEKIILSINKGNLLTDCNAVDTKDHSIEYFEIYKNLIFYMKYKIFDVNVINAVLYTHLSLYFIACGLLLFASMVVSIALVLKPTTDVDSVKFKKVQRNHRETHEAVKYYRVICKKNTKSKLTQNTYDHLSTLNLNKKKEKK